MAETHEVATVGAGCFWGVEEAFRTLPGVLATEVGYAGGTTENPTYEDVCSHRTGHAEVVRVTFDPSILPYEKLLEAFWSCHDPTQLNRQGPDLGTQYRSVIFTHSEEQRRAAEESKKKLAEAKKYTEPVVTDILPAPPFYRAEEYHQKYLMKRGEGACHI